MGSPQIFHGQNRLTWHLWQDQFCEFPARQFSINRGASLQLDLVPGRESSATTFARADFNSALGTCSKAIAAIGAIGFRRAAAHITSV